MRQNTDQHTNDVMLFDEENQPNISDETKRREFDDISQCVIDDIDFLERENFWKAKIILNKINRSRKISLDVDSKDSH